MEAKPTNRVTQIVIEGKLIAIEQGMISGLMTSETVRFEAQNLIKQYPEDEISNEQRERLRTLLSAGLGPNRLA
jgi:hypothetical protein